MHFINNDDRLDLFKEIEAYQTICLFRHEQPDGDAYGSQVGLALYLKDRYPKKDIFCLGEDGGLKDFFPPMDLVDEATIQNSLALVLDTANAGRISDQRALMANRLIKIDHHPDPEKVNDYGYKNYVYPSASSSCEIVSDMIMAMDPDRTLPLEIAQALYIGMVTDTLGFTTRSVTSHSFTCAAYLMKSGIPVDQVNQDLFDVDDHIFRFQAYLVDNMYVTDQGFAYCLVSRQVLTDYGLSAPMAKEQVNVFKPLRKVKTWALMIQNKEGLYNVSMRSKNVVIADMARFFGGGGHDLACACRNLNDQDLQQLVTMMNQRLQNEA